MFTPKKIKHRKWFKGRSLKRKFDSRGTRLSYGSFGLKSESSAWVNGKQLEASRRAISNFIQREGKVWIRVFPDKPITQHAAEATMGGGKGDVKEFVVPVYPGRILFEMDGIPEDVARKALRLAGHKLPLITRIVSK